MYLAFKWVAVTLMLVEINHCVGKLGLPEQVPVTRQQLKYVNVIDPNILQFCARLDTALYSYSFFESEKLRYVTKLDQFDGMGSLEFSAKFAGVKSLINTNEAYRIATNWLTAISVDVSELERTNSTSVEQWDWQAQSNSTPKLVPIFEVRWGEIRWGEIRRPKIQVRIDGRTRSLLHLRLEDDSFSRRPAPLLKDRAALLKIGDDEFRSYASDQRSALVRRFSNSAQPTNSIPYKDQTQPVL